VVDRAGSKPDIEVEGGRERERKREREIDRWIDRGIERERARLIDR